MKKIYYISALCFFLSLPSCMIDKGDTSSRTASKLRMYSEDVLNSRVKAPAAIVAIATDVAEYLELTENDAADTKSISPEGIDHIIRVEDVADIYTDGQDIRSTVGAVWTLKNIYLQGDENGSYYGYAYYLSCRISLTAPSIWEIVYGDYTDEDGATFTVRYQSGDVYTVISDGEIHEMNDYITYYKTGTEGVTMNYESIETPSATEDEDTAEAVSNENLYVLSRFSVDSGRFEVRMYHGYEMLDYCYMTFAAGDTTYDVSL